MHVLKNWKKREMGCSLSELRSSLQNAPLKLLKIKKKKKTRWPSIIFKLGCEASRRTKTEVGKSGFV